MESTTIVQINFSHVVISCQLPVHMTPRPWTKSRTLPLIASVPYVKEWIQRHPQGTNASAWLFISLSRQNRIGQITWDVLLRKYQQYYKKRFFPMLLEETNVPFFLVLYFKLLNISSDISERKEFQSLNTIIEVQNMLFSEPIIL